MLVKDDNGTDNIAMFQQRSDTLRNWVAIDKNAVRAAVYHRRISICINRKFAVPLGHAGIVNLEIGATTLATHRDFAVQGKHTIKKYSAPDLERSHRASSPTERLASHVRQVRIDSGGLRRLSW